MSSGLLLLGAGSQTVGGGLITDPHFANVLLLCGFEGADASTTLTDESSHGRTATANGNAQIDTAVALMGTSSGLFDGTGDFWTFPDSTDWDFSGQFTIEGFFRTPTMGVGTRCLIAKRNATSTNIAWELIWTGGATPGIGFEFSTDGTNIAHNVSAVAAGLLLVDTRYHIAVDRDGSDKIRIYLDGVMKASKTSASGTAFNSTTPLSIGARNNTGNPNVGWIDELRITTGVARYASDGGFTPPTVAFPRS